LKRVIVKFISVFAEKMGREKVYDLDDSATLKDLVELIAHEIEDVKSKGVFYVNYRLASENQTLKNGDEILVTPLFAGG
jgi:molybdopterin converting factor small subunit